MSLILEALRRSEAERQRGQAPSMRSALQEPVERSSRGRGGLLLALPVLLATGWLGAYLWQAMAPREQQPAPPATLHAPPSQHANTDRSPRETADAAVRASDPAPPLPIQAAETTTAREPANASPTRSEAERVEREAAAPGDPLASTPAAAAESAPTPAATTSVETAEDALPLAALDSQRRAQLPPLKLSMHVWNEQPALRFAIVDGQRLGEGARLDDLVVAHITRDGVILDWQQQRLLLPRP